MSARTSSRFLAGLARLVLAVALAARVFAARQVGPILLSVGRISDGGRPPGGAQRPKAPGDTRPGDLSVQASVHRSLGYEGILRPAPSPPLPREDGAVAPTLRRAADRLRARLAALRARLAAHRLDLTIIGTLLIAVGVVHGLNMGSSPAFFDDEGTYVAQAWSVTHLGELAPYTYWYDHPPLGWLTMGAWSLIAQPFGSGGWSIADFRTLMLMLSLVNAILMYAIAQRLAISRPFAALAVVLFALSPLAVHYQRMVLLDNFAVTWTLLAFLLVLSPRRQLAAHIAAGLCFAAAVLTKETFLLVLPALVLLAWQRAEGPTRSFSITLFLAGFGLVAVFYPLYAALQGELLPGAGHTSLFDGLKFQLTRPGGGGLVDPHSGTRQLIDGWLRDDPVLLPAALVLTPIALLSARLRAVALAFALPVLVASRPTAYVPAMFVLGLLPFAALIAAGVADGVWRWARRKARRSDRPGRLQAIAAAPVVLVVIGALALVAGPMWARADLNQMSHDDQSAGRQAVEWLDRNVDHRSTLLVDDTVWVDLVQRGFAPQRTVWFYKLDLDPAVPVGWQRFDYVLRSNMMEGNAKDLPRTSAVLAHSRPVATFTDGPERMEVRRVVSPHPPPLQSSRKTTAR